MSSKNPLKERALDRMVKVTREEIECDKCGKPAKRYTISYEDGIKTLDRCEQHARGLEKFRDEPGEWTGLSGGNGKRGLRVLTPQEIEAQRQ